MINLQEIVDYINNSHEKSKIYIGGDSRRFLVNNIWTAYYAVVVVIHINSNNGCRIFGYKEKEPDYDRKRNKPVNRLMTEVYKIADMYLQLSPLIKDREIQVHLDINPSEKHASNSVMQQAMGYINGVCGVNPIIKPNSFAASSAADRFLR
jgi:predicted RNase H-related nuclease YkuK (DUF458 family)